MRAVKLAGVVLLASLVVTPTASAADVFALDIGFVSDDFISFPVLQPANETVISGTLGTAINPFAMDFNSTATTLYAIDSDTNNLGTIDTGTGAWSPLVTTSGWIAGHTITGLSVDPTDETFYVSSTDGATSYLYSLNTGTGVVSPIGSTGVDPLRIDIAIDATGQMYGHDISTDSLYSIDKATGQATLIGATGVNANYAQGMDFDYSTNTLYAILYEGGGANTYASIDLNTGLATPIAGLRQGEFEMAINAPIPEPTTGLLVGLGTLLFVRRR